MSTLPTREEIAEWRQWAKRGYRYSSPYLDPTDGEPRDPTFGDIERLCDAAEHAIELEEENATLRAQVYCAATFTRDEDRELAAHRATIARQQALLRKLEWASRARYGNTCPSCYGNQREVLGYVEAGHLKTCELRAMLDALDKEER